MSRVKVFSFTVDLLRYPTPRKLPSARITGGSYVWVLTVDGLNKGFALVVERVLPDGK